MRGKDSSGVDSQYLKGHLESKQQPSVPSVMGNLIGKYLSSLRKLDHVITPKEGFETQL